MRSLAIFFCAVALGACSATPSPPSYQPVASPTLPTPPIDYAKMQRDGDVLLAKWTTCRTDAARDLAKSTKIPTEEVPQRAYEKCHVEREAWVDSQVSPGMNHTFLETVADRNEHCLYTTLAEHVGNAERPPAALPNCTSPPPK